MRWGSLDDVFDGIAWKALSAHEVDPKVSNGHEFQGVARLKELLGTEKRTYPTTYLLLSDDADAAVESIESEASWYDARENQTHRAAEWRLYYPEAAGRIQSAMKAGDLMIIAKRKDDSLVVMLAPQESESASRLKLLFELSETSSSKVNTRTFDHDAKVGFLANEILVSLGYASPYPEEDEDGIVVLRLAAELGSKHLLALPKGIEIATLIQTSLKGTHPRESPDETLVRWIEAEETVFRLWEDGLIQRRIDKGFRDAEGSADVKGFREFTMSIRQSRVSRAGGALQHHTAAILRAHHLKFEPQASTENGERPDFLFPGSTEYDDTSFDAKRLRMLAVKFTAKDRWRQVLNEAERISKKHMLTMEPTISIQQLTGMHAAKLQPIIPQPYRSLYPEPSQRLIIPLSEFLSEVRAAQ